MVCFALGFGWFGLGICGLESYKEQLDHRRKLLSRYNDRIKNISGIKMINDNKYTGYNKNIYQSVKPVKSDYPIVITKLAKGQQLSFTCSVRKGISQEHAKFQPTSSVGYKILSDNEFLFNVETTGSLTPVEVVDKALDIYNNRCSNILKNL